MRHSFAADNDDPKPLEENHKFTIKGHRSLSARNKVMQHHLRLTFSLGRSGFQDQQSYRKGKGKLGWGMAGDGPSLVV